MLKAVIFDCDGTLVNSVSFFHAAHSYAAEQHGGTVPTFEQFHAVAITGMPLHEMYELLQPGKDHEAMLAANGEYVRAHMMEMKSFSHLQETLQELIAMGLTVGLVTGGTHQVHDILDHHKVKGHFSSIVHAGRIQKSKPDPEGFLLAAQECNVLPSEAIMVGDTIADIGAGKNGHALATIGVTHGVSTRKQLEDGGADYVVDSLDEVLTLVKKLIVR